MELNIVIFKYFEYVKNLVTLADDNLNKEFLSLVLYEPMTAHFLTNIYSTF